MLSLLLAINTETLSKSLTILWQGLLAILVVVAIIIAVTYLLKYVVTKVTEGKNKNAKPVDNQEEDD